MVLSAAQVRSGEDISPNNNQREYSVIYLSPNFLLHIILGFRTSISRIFQRTSSSGVYCTVSASLCTASADTGSRGENKDLFRALCPIAFWCSVPHCASCSCRFTGSSSVVFMTSAEPVDGTVILKITEGNGLRSGFYGGSTQDAISVGITMEIKSRVIQ